MEGSCCQCESEAILFHRVEMATGHAAWWLPRMLHRAPPHWMFVTHPFGDRASEAARVPRQPQELTERSGF